GDTLANTGTVLVDAKAELQLTNATTIDNTGGGKITNHGEIESVVGTNIIKNAASFTSDGLIEVVGGAATGAPNSDGDFTTAVPTLVLDGDPLANTGTVLVDAKAELQLTNATTINNAGGGKITNHGEIESVVGINTIQNVASFTSDGLI